MLERLKRTKDLEDPEELTTDDLTQVETETKVESPSTGFGSALSAEKQALLDRVGKLEGEVKHAKLDQAKALQKQNDIAKEAEVIAKRLKAIEVMEGIYKQ